jgi:phage-related minor tail protein
LAFSFGQEMMPAIQGIVTSMTEWGAQNKELIKTKLQEVAEKIAQSIKTLGENLPGIIDRVSRFVDAIGGMKTVLIGAGLVITGPLISAIATLSATLLTTPVGWFIGAVGLIAGAGAMIMGKWNPVEKFFPDLWDGIVEHVGGTIYKMVELFQNFTPAGLIIKHWDPLTDFFSDTWQNILKIFEAGMAKVMPIVNKLTKVADKVTKPVKKLFEFGGNAADAVTGAASDAYNGVRNFFGGDDTPRESILPKGQATQVGGQVTVKIDSEGRPKVQQVRSDNPSVGIDVDAGMSLVGAM